MMGHALEGSEGPYSRPEVVVLQDAYSRVYSHLAVTENAEQTSRVKMLEAQVASLQMNGYTKKSEIDDLKSRFEMLETENKELKTKMQEHVDLKDLQALIQQNIEKTLAEFKKKE